jgi:competence protein ComEC
MFRVTVPVLCLALCCTALLTAQPRTLDIYWVDVEGGGATLLVTPAGESFLVDTGNPGDRDAGRIFNVATKQAGLKKIDYLFTTHYHDDHVGGAPELAKLIPIAHYYDHGESVEKTPVWNAYQTLAQRKRTIVKPGDVLPLKGVTVQVVSSAGKVLTTGLKGSGPNALCAGAQQHPEDTGENGQSAGVLITFGKFRFFDAGDLTWDREMQLACPENKIGTVTMVQATHHGFFNDASGAPALYNALRPQTVVINNGAKKGLLPPAYELISKMPGVEGIWQLHEAVGSDKAHNTAGQKIANPGNEDGGHWLKASVSQDGSYTITNSRNRFSQTYQPR